MRASIYMVAIAFTFVGCAQSPRGLDWRIEVAPGLSGRYVVARARIARGGCGRTDVIYDEDATSTLSAPTPPKLPSGSYGFEVTLLDATCTVVGRGCTQVTLPTKATDVVVQVMPDAEPERECDPSVCVAGVCMQSSMHDAGRGTSTRDASARDASTFDAAPHVSDAAARDDASEADMSSEAGVSDGGDAGIDPYETACDARFGMARAYVFCGATPSTCTFSVELDLTTCDSVCTSFGAMCLGAINNDGPCEAGPPGDTCATATRFDDMCICTRP